MRNKTWNPNDPPFFGGGWPAQFYGLNLVRNHYLTLLLWSHVTISFVSHPCFCSLYSNIYIYISHEIQHGTNSPLHHTQDSGMVVYPSRLYLPSNWDDDDGILSCARLDWWNFCMQIMSIPGVSDRLIWVCFKALVWPSQLDFFYTKNERFCFNWDTPVWFTSINFAWNQKHGEKTKEHEASSNLNNKSPQTCRQRPASVAGARLRPANG